MQVTIGCYAEIGRFVRVVTVPGEPQRCMKHPEKEERKFARRLAHQAITCRATSSGSKEIMPEIGFEDIQQDVKRIRETLGDLKTIHDQLNKARSVACVIINDTDSPLAFVGDHHDHGAFASGGVPVTIPPRAAAAFGSQSHGGAIATGTEGLVRYEGGGVRLKCYWNNPFIGENGSAVSLGAGDPNHYLYWSTTGAGDQKAEMQYALFQRPMQNAWRYCKWCTCMFYDGYPAKGVCPGHRPSRGMLSAIPPGSPVPVLGHVAEGYDFFLPHSAPASRGREDRAQWDWRFCHKCNSMFYDGYTPKGACHIGRSGPSSRPVRCQA
jgi:hypothetical protein